MVYEQLLERFLLLFRHSVDEIKHYNTDIVDGDGDPNDIRFYFDNMDWMFEHLSSVMHSKVWLSSTDLEGGFNASRISMLQWAAGHSPYWETALKEDATFESIYSFMQKHDLTIYLDKLWRVQYGDVNEQVQQRSIQRDTVLYLLGIYWHRTRYAERWAMGTASSM